MILVVPALTQFTIPVFALTVATLELLLLQLPPVSPSLVYCSEAPMQSGEFPFTIPGFTS